MINKIVLVVLISALLTGCGGSSFNPINPPAVHAGATPNSVFNGRYIFQSHGKFADGREFNEGGTIEADGQGGFILNSTMNVIPSELYHPANVKGTYSLDATFRGTAGQEQTGDKESLFCTPDGARCMMVSEIIGFTWLATLEKD